MGKWKKQWVDAQTDRAMTSILRQMKENARIFPYGVPMARYVLGNTHRLLEVYRASTGLKPEEHFYSIQLYCSEPEFDAGQYADTVGIMKGYVTEPGKTGEEDLRKILRMAIDFHASTLPPMILEINTFANLCGHFHNAYLTDGISFNNGYNCHHCEQAETMEENGMRFGACHCHSCPLGHPAYEAELAAYGITDPEELDISEAAESSSDYIVVTDPETVWRLREKDVYGLAVKEVSWEQADNGSSDTEGTTVFLLIASQSQKEFTFQGKSAEAEESVVAVYSTKEKAETEMAKLKQEADTNMALYDADPIEFRIEPRTIR